MKMFVDAPAIYLHRDPVDFRKAVNGLALIVEQQMELSPFSEALFVFCNRRQNILKILYWDRNGFCLWHKRLEKHHFNWPRSIADVMEIEPRSLGWLLDGLKLDQPMAHSSLKYSITA
jgi:transposase